MTKNIIILLLISSCAVLLSLPLLETGFYQIHDDQQIARLFVFDQALMAGQFPVRWVEGLGFGFGYPLFVFYPPLVYITGELFHLIGFGFINSIKIVFFLSIFLSGVTMYIFVKEIWGKFPAVISALFYMVVPYRALDVYVRGALAESFTFVWLPLILWSFYKMLKTHNPSFIYLSGVLLALLMVTHNLIYLPFLLLLPFYALFLIMKSSNIKLSVFYSFLAVLISLFLSAFFWMPSLLEKQFTIVDELLIVNLASYKIHFTYPQQLWNWTWGFGGSAVGLADGISFKIGKLHIIVAVFAFFLAIAHLLKNITGNKLSTFNLQLSTLFFFLFLLSAFMTTLYSEFIWDLIPPLAYLQFPWRFLTFTALFSSILVGALIYLLKITFLRLIVGSVLVILLLFPNLKLFQPQAHRFNLTDEIATSDEVINWDVSASSFEYIPKGVDLLVSDRGTNVINIQRDDIPISKVEVVSGDAKMNNIITKPNKLSFTAESPSGATIKGNIFSFPGWVVKINGQEVRYNDSNRLKLISFKIPKGLSKIEITFNNTIVRSLANHTSLFSVIILIILIYRRWPTHHNN